MSAGQTVLITAAAGATGHFGVQLAKLAGCHVIATVGSAEKAGIVQELGADRVINYHEEVAVAHAAWSYCRCALLLNAWQLIGIRAAFIAGAACWRPWRQLAAA